MGYIAKIGGEQVPISITREGDCHRIKVGDKEFVVDAYWTQNDLISLIIDGRSFQVDIHSTMDNYGVMIEGENFEFELYDERKALLKSSAGLGTEGAQEITTSMPGKIVKVLVSEGDEVSEGDGLIIVEAMKMENEMKSPKAGVVKKIDVGEGDTVEAGSLLVIVE